MDLLVDNLPQYCLVFDKYEDAATVQNILIKNGYCTMMGKEEDMWTLNWIWTEIADRNRVIFADWELYDLERSQEKN